MARIAVRRVEAQDMDDSFERTYQILVFMKKRLGEEADLGMPSQTHPPHRLSLPTRRDPESDQLHRPTNWECIKRPILGPCQYFCVDDRKKVFEC